MALPASVPFVTSGAKIPQGGPYRATNGNTYHFYANLSATDTVTFRVLKTTDPATVAFSEVYSVGLTPSAGSSLNWKKDTVQHGDYVYTMIAMTDTTNYVTYSYVIVYDILNDVASTPELVWTSVIDSNWYNNAASITWDDTNGKVWILYGGDDYRNMGKSYRQMKTAYRADPIPPTDPGTWTTELDGLKTGTANQVTDGNINAGSACIHAYVNYYGISYYNTCGDITFAGVENGNYAAAGVNYRPAPQPLIEFDPTYLQYVYRYNQNFGTDGAYSWSSLTSGFLDTPSLSPNLVILDSPGSIGWMRKRPDNGHWVRVQNYTGTNSPYDVISFREWNGSAYGDSTEIATGTDPTHENFDANIYYTGTDVVIAFIYYDTANAGWYYDEYNLSGAPGPEVDGAVSATGVATVTAAATVSGIQTGQVSANALATTTIVGSQFGVQLGQFSASALATTTISANITLAIVDLHLTAFEFHRHLGYEETYTKFANINQNVNLEVNKHYGLRLQIENQGNKSTALHEFQLQKRKNSGTWENVTTNSTDVLCNWQPVVDNLAPGFLGVQRGDGWEERAFALFEGPKGTLNIFSNAQMPSAYSGCGQDAWPRAIFRQSYDLGATWQSSHWFNGENNSGPCYASFLINVMHNSDASIMRIWYVANDGAMGNLGAILTSTDNGQTWGNQYPIDYDASQQATLSDLQTSNMVMAEDGTLYFWVAYRPYISPSWHMSITQYKSTDGGQNWAFTTIVADRTYSSQPVSYNAYVIVDVGIEPVTGALLVFFVFEDTVYLITSSDGGDTWSSDITIQDTTVGGGTFPAKFPSTSGLNFSNYSGYAWSSVAQPKKTVLGYTPNGGVILPVYYQGTYYDPVSGLSLDNDYLCFYKSMDLFQTWKTIYLGNEPPDEISQFYGSSFGGWSEFSGPQRDQGHTKSLIFSAVRNDTYFINEYPAFQSNYDDERNGPWWWCYDEEQDLITGPIFTIANDEVDYYHVSGLGYHLGHSRIFCLAVDHRGDYHIAPEVEVQYYYEDGIKLFYDAKARYRDLQNMEMSWLTDDNTIAHKLPNLGYSNDGTFGPVRIHGRQKVEFDIRLWFPSTSVSNGDVIEFRIDPTQLTDNDVTPQATIAASETDLYADNGTIKNSGVRALCSARTTLTATPLFRDAYEATVPVQIATGVTLHPYSRKSGPYTNYANHTFYFLLYSSTNGTVQFYKASGDRTVFWSAVGSVITVGATDAIWVEQGKYGYEHILYIAIQSDDGTGNVNFYEFDTSSDTLSTLVIIRPNPQPLNVCVSIVVRNNGGTPQVLVSYNDSPTSSYQRCSLSIRDCAGGSWTSGVIADGRQSDGTLSYQHATLVEGSPGNVHIWYQIGPENGAYSDALFVHTLYPNNTLSDASGIAGVTTTFSGFDADLVPTGAAVAFYTDNDGWETRCPFSWLGGAEIDCMRAWENDDGSATLTSSLNVLAMTPYNASGNDYYWGGSNDGSNMVLLASDASPLVHENNWFFRISSGLYLAMGYDTDPSFHPGFDLIISTLRSSGLDTQKLTGAYLNVGGGGTVIALGYSYAGNMYYDEWVIETPTYSPMNDKFGFLSAVGVGNLTISGGYIEEWGSESASGVGTATIGGTVVPYDPNKYGSAAESGKAILSIKGARNYAAKLSAQAAAHTPNMYGGLLRKANMIVVGVSKTTIGSTVFTETAPLAKPIDVVIYRDGPGSENSVQNTLITSELVALEYGRNELDEKNLDKRDVSVTVLERDGLRLGQVVHVYDELRGLILIGKITGVKHDMKGVGQVPVATLSVSVPLIESA